MESVDRRQGNGKLTYKVCIGIVQIEILNMNEENVEQSQHTHRNANTFTFNVYYT